MVALEAKLEALFADQSADDRQVRTIVDQIGAAQAGLRFIHLKYHLAIRAEMTPDQIHGYAMLRGYTAGKH